MKKIALAAAAGLSYLVATAATALAQSTLPPPNDPEVGGTIVTPPGGTAFTGSEIGIWLVAIVALLAVGTTLIVVGRRRRATALG
jgi:hypothetical protein